MGPRGRNLSSNLSDDMTCIVAIFVVLQAGAQYLVDVLVSEHESFEPCMRELLCTAKLVS